MDIDPLWATGGVVSIFRLHGSSCINCYDLAADPQNLQLPHPPRAPPRAPRHDLECGSTPPSPVYGLIPSDISSLPKATL